MEDLPLSILLGQEAIEDAGGIKNALIANRQTALAADVLLAHLYSINKKKGLMLAEIYS
ncbi:MAG: hypothetical protein Q8K61_08750 [Gallionella sp.]|nr:hypothetical protein [Gallionella sp.]